MKVKKGWIAFVLLAVFVMGAIFWWRSPSSKPAKKDLVKHLAPTILVTSMNITDIDKDRIKIKSKVSLKNPLPVDLSAKGLTYQIFIDSEKILQDDYAKPIRIRSKDSTTIELPMELFAKPLKEILEYFDKNKVDSADYSIKAMVKVQVPVAGQRDFAMNLSKRLPAIRIPKVKVEHVDLHPFKLKKEGCDVEVKVSNPNLFPLKMKDAVFSFGIGNGDIQMDGKMDN